MSTSEDTSTSAATDKAVFSRASDNAFMRLDGSGINAFNASGAGTVNCQYYTDPQVKAKMIKSYERTASFTDPSRFTGFGIRSLAFPNCYLRLDGSGLSASNPKRKATLQYYASESDFPYNNSYELFVADKNGGIQSVQFPGVYVYFDVDGVDAFNTAGSGQIYAHYGLSGKNTQIAQIYGPFVD